MIRGKQGSNDLLDKLESLAEAKEIYFRLPRCPVNR